MTMENIKKKCDLASQLEGKSTYISKYFMFEISRFYSTTEKPNFTNGSKSLVVVIRFKLVVTYTDGRHR